MSKARAEGADPNYEWTQEDRERLARGEIMVEQARYGRITGEEALLLTIIPPDDERLDALVKERADGLRLPLSGGSNTPRATADRPAAHREREHERYHSDPDYREKRLEQFKARRAAPGYKEKDAARKRLARLRAKGQA